MNKSIKTYDKLQNQDDFYIDEKHGLYFNPTDNRLKDFKVGKLVSFRDRQDLIRGVVGGFSMTGDCEQVWVKPKDPAIEQHRRHRADEVEFVGYAKEVKETKKEEPKAKKEPKKELKGKKETKKDVKSKNRATK